jgi:sporulation protein YlmC with PRC-barrel domain
MNIKFSKSLLAGVTATLLAAPGWPAAQQLQSPQPDSGRYDQSTGGVSASHGYQIRSLPEGAMPARHPAGGATQGNDTLLSALTPQHLMHMEVVGVSGEKIGEVEDVVRSREDGFIYVVVSSGGLLGIGAKEVTVPFKELEVQGDHQLLIGTTKDDLQRWPEYQEDQYVALEPSNKPVSDFAAFEVIPPKGSKTDSEPTLHLER